MRIRLPHRVHSLSPIAFGLIVAIAFGGACMALPALATVGSAPAVLNCKSVGAAGGSVSLSGEIPGDYEVFDVKVRRGKEEYEIKSLNKIDRDLDPELRTKLEDDGVIAKDRVITVVEDFRRGVFTMALRRGERYDLRLYALPATIRARFGPNSKKATFDAMFFEGEVGDSKPVRMRCTYDHSI